MEEAPMPSARRRAPSSTPSPSGSRRPLIRLALAALLLAAAAPPLAAGESDPRAVELADHLLEALGGRQAWEAVHFVRFTFAGFRTHHWDKWTGRHRLEYSDRQGDRYLVLDDVDTRQGRAWKNGEPLAGDELAKALEDSYAAWVNDTYWLLMPYKLRDPGVNLSYAGEETVDGKDYDKVALTFDSVGLTPGDRYWAYINRQTGMMDRWAYILQSYPPDRPATGWLWEDWERYGGILLSSRRVSVEGGRELPLSDIAVTDTMPDSVFDSPEPVAGEAP
jgi:Family of unknown function (DUF6503)